MKCRAWLFDMNAAFMMIAYYRSSTHTIDHFQWYLGSLSKDGDSHFTQSLSVNQVDVFDSCLSRADILHMAVLVWVAPATSEFAAVYALLVIFLFASPTWQLKEGCSFLVVLMMTGILVVLWLADLHECIQVDDCISTQQESHLLTGWVAPPLAFACFLMTFLACLVTALCSCAQVGVNASCTLCSGPRVDVALC